MRRDLLVIAVIGGKEKSYAKSSGGECTSPPGLIPIATFYLLKGETDKGR